MKEVSNFKRTSQTKFFKKMKRRLKLTVNLVLLIDYLLMGSMMNSITNLHNLTGSKNNVVIT